MACAAVRVAVGQMGLSLCIRMCVLADSRGVASGANGCSLSPRALHRRRVPVRPPARAAWHPSLPRSKLLSP